MSSRPFPQPRFSFFLYGITRLFGRIYLKRVLGVRSVETFHAERFERAIQSFKEENQRLIIAFRHTAVEDAPLLLVGTAKKTHLSFLYGRDVLNWAGASARLFFPRLSFIAVQNRGTDRAGLTYLKEAAKAGRFPLALAPEGQVTYHAHRTASIEAGVASLALWGEENASGVTIIPVAIAYRYSKDSNALLIDLIERWQAVSTITLAPASFEEMLVSACEHSLLLVANRWQLSLPTLGTFVERRDRLCEALLSKAEEQASLAHQDSSIIDRLYRLRFAAEDLLFHSPEATESEKENARSFLVAVQTVDVLEYLDPSYITENPSTARMVEVALNLLDIPNRLDGGSINTRYSPKQKVGALYFGEPIDIALTADPAASRKTRTGRVIQAVALGLQKSSTAIEEEWTRFF